MSLSPAVARLTLRRPGLIIAAVVFLAVILGLFGGVLVAAGLQDYSSYTENAAATISDVVRTSHASAGKNYVPTYSYYVDFEADGETFTHQSLDGVITGSPRVGDTVTVVFPPGEPAKAVTELTTSAGARSAELWIGIGLLVLGVAALAGIITWAVRRRRPEQDARPETTVTPAQ